MWASALICWYLGVLLIRKTKDFLQPVRMFFKHSLHLISFCLLQSLFQESVRPPPSILHKCHLFSVFSLQGEVSSLSCTLHAYVLHGLFCHLLQFYFPCNLVLSHLAYLIGTHLIFFSILCVLCLFSIYRRTYVTYMKVLTYENHHPP